MTQIDYNKKKETLSFIRNGYIWTDGIRLYTNKAGEVQINPINSKGRTASGYVTIPKEHIQDLINELEKLK